MFKIGYLIHYNYEQLMRWRYGASFCDWFEDPCNSVTYLLLELFCLPQFPDEKNTTGSNILKKKSSSSKTLTPTSASQINDVNPNFSLFKNSLSISLFRSSIELGDLLDLLDTSSIGELYREFGFSSTLTSPGSIFSSTNNE